MFHRAGLIAKWGRGTNRVVELQEDSVVNDLSTTAAAGKRYRTNYFNLDIITSVGYRVKSRRGTQFRIWATQRLREYIIKGFTLDDERLKQAGGGNCFDELLARIRDIRSSEKVFWRKVLEIYASSIDYDPDTDMFAKQWKEMVCLFNELRPSAWDQVEACLETNGEVGNAEVRAILRTDDPVEASKLIKSWVDLGLLAIANPVAAKRNPRYVRPGKPLELSLVYPDKIASE